MSIALHAAVLGATARLSWVATDLPTEPPPAVVWVTEVPRSPAEPPEAPPSPPERASADSGARPPAAVAARAEAVPPPRPAVPPAPEVPAEVGASPEVPAEAEVRPEAPAETEASPEGPPEDGTEAEPTPRRYVVRDVDPEEARRRAVEQTSERIARENRYRTFSLDDVAEEEAPAEEAAPDESVFEARGSGRDRSVLSAGKAKSRFGRRMAELCNALTSGGFSVFGLVDVCTDPGPTATMFAHLKPAYMRSTPVCTEVPVESTAATAGGAGTDPAEPTTVKCRLVLDE